MTLERRQLLDLGILIIFSSFFAFFNLGIEGLGNPYYAAGVHSLLIDPKHFFYLPYDPRGFLSLDKPPIGFWLQALSASVFGLSGFSLFLPQALASIASVLILYRILARRYGESTGFLGGLCLTFTPLFTAMGRSNNIDNLLALAFLLALALLLESLEKGEVRYLFGSFGLVGIAFNIKMSAALFILPALILGYWFGSTTPWKKKGAVIGTGLAITVALSLAWAIAVDLTPPAQRPWVSNSTNNSELSLIAQYNGLSRLGLEKRAQTVAETHHYSTDSSLGESLQSKFARTLDKELRRTLGSEASWFLAPALIGAVILLVSRRKGLVRLWREDPILIFSAIWVVTCCGIFMDPRLNVLSYYPTILAPAVCALGGWALVHVLSTARTASLSFLKRALFLAASLLGEFFLSRALIKFSWGWPIALSIVSRSLARLGGRLDDNCLGS